MKPSTWATLAAAFAAELLDKLVDRLKSEGREFAIGEAADTLARGVMRLPLEVRKHAQASITTEMVGALAKVLHLSPATTLALANAVGQRLVEMTLRDDLMPALDDFAEKQAKWERLLK